MTDTRHLCNGCDVEFDTPGPVFCASCDEVVDTYTLTAEQIHELDFDPDLSIWNAADRAYDDAREWRFA